MLSDEVNDNDIVVDEYHSDQETVSDSERYMLIFSNNS